MCESSDASSAGLISVAAEAIRLHQVNNHFSEGGDSVRLQMHSSNCAVLCCALF